MNNAVRKVRSESVTRNLAQQIKEREQGSTTKCNCDEEIVGELVLTRAKRSLTTRQILFASVARL